MSATLEQYALCLSSSKGDTYLHLAPENGYKQGAWYLDNLNAKHRRAICRFRCRNTYHRVETGAWNNIPRDLRLCRLCGVLDDDTHYILVCGRYDAQRVKYIPGVYLDSPDKQSLVELLNSRDKGVLHRLAMYLIDTAPQQRAQYEIDKNIDQFSRFMFSLG